MVTNCKLRSVNLADIEADSDRHCSGDGLDVTLLAEESEEDAHSHEDHDHGEEEPASAEGISCDFHAGVECVMTSASLHLPC